MSKLRTRLLGALKWSFAVFVLFYLIHSGRLSLSDLRQLLASPGATMAAVGCTIVILLASFQRWRLLLKAQAVEISYFQALKLGMLGQFFSAFMPGTVGGDLMKAVYVARRYPSRKARVISTLFVDRVTGFTVMIFLGATAFLFGRARLANAEGAALLQTLGWTLVAGAFALLIGLLIFPKLPLKWFRRFGTSFTEALESYQRGIPFVWGALGLAAGMQMLNVTVLYIFAHSLAGPLPWGGIDLPLFVMASIMGLVAQALPVAPMGIGVGQAAFAAIFHLLGAPSDTFGATLVTGLQLVNFCLNLTGAFFFATYRHEVEEAKTWPAKA